MCGIAGFNWQDKAIIEKMGRCLRHRGPDDQGYYLDEQVSLGHQRLAIIDVSDQGHQPMLFENLAIVYNGEVYNYQEIRQELSRLGYQFHSHTDTEVVLYSYHRWGQECVKKFNGMWAFCIYDQKERKLFLSRDRFGIKPLYYYFDGKRFIFASELTAIMQHQLPRQYNDQAVNFFFYQKYVGADLAIFENCRKVKPAENLTFDLASKNILRSRYYDLEAEVAGWAAKPVGERAALVESLLVDAVNKRLIADVPVGSFLSGGVDSSLISAIIAQNKDDFDTFSIGFKEASYDEVKYSEIVARHIKTRHHVQYLDVDESLAQKVLDRIDEPFGDASLLPTYLLSQMTRQDVTVSLSGDGGDEVFGGYDTYQAYQIARYLPAAVVKAIGPLAGLLGASEKKLSLRFKLQKFTADFSGNTQRRHLDWMAAFPDRLRRELLREHFIPAADIIDFRSDSDLLSVQLNDMEHYLPGDILKKVDAASMLHSLEARVPYLDYRLVGLVLSLPPAYKIRYFRTKWLLKKIAADYLPADIVQRKKRGFTVPISRWVKESELVREFIVERRYYPDLLNYDYVQRLISEHVAGRADNSRPLWQVFVFNYWNYSRAKDPN